MPIGKNSIKRVENGGYAKIESSAPDMEKSSVVPEVPAATAEKKPAAKKQTATSKTENKTSTGSAKKQPAKKTSGKNTSEQPQKKKTTAQSVKTPEKKQENVTRNGFVRYSFGDQLPPHLL